MSKQTLIAAVIAITVVFVGGYYHFMNKASLKAPLVQDTSILLYVEDGDVSYKTEGGLFIKATSSPIAIEDNTVVYTGLGHASILFPNNSTVTLDQYTELTVHYSDKKVSMYQTLGTTYHRVEALISGSTYEVETPGTVASVRGTKFAVKYDKQTMTTKVAVTEHQVLVAKTEITTGTTTATTTKKILESVLLEEGKTAKVERRATSTATTSIGVITTTEEKDMEVWVEKNKKQDDVEKTLKEERKSKEEIRKEIKKILNKEEGAQEDVNQGEDPTKDSKSAPSSDRNTSEQKKKDTASSTNERTQIKKEDTSKSASEVKKTETAKETETRDTAPAKKTETNFSNVNTNSDNGNGSNSGGTSKKMDEDTFYDKFNTLFVNYFYVDDSDAVCSYKVSAAERLRIVMAFASENGYGFQAKNLADFASDISAYCANKDVRTKADLQGRFDREFPYQENI